MNLFVKVFSNTAVNYETAYAPIGSSEWTPLLRGRTVGYSAHIKKGKLLIYT